MLGNGAGDVERENGEVFPSLPSICWGDEHRRLSLKTYLERSPVICVSHAA